MIKNPKEVFSNLLVTVVSGTLILAKHWQMKVTSDFHSNMLKAGSDHSHPNNK